MKSFDMVASIRVLLFLSLLQLGHSFGETTTLFKVEHSNIQCPNGFGIAQQRIKLNFGSNYDKHFPLWAVTFD